MLILGRRSFAKIAQPIVGAVAIDVINVLRWPTIMGDRPDDPMSGHRNRTNTDCNIAVCRFGSCWLATMLGDANVLPPEKTRFWIIRECRLDVCDRG